MDELIIKALPFWQPWAWLVANNLKQYDTRPRVCNHRGVTAIFAARLRLDYTDREISPTMEQYLRADLGAYRLELSELAYGAVIGLGNLICDYPTQKVRLNISGKELAYGNYDIGRRALEFKDCVLFDTPVPVRGFQSLFNWSVPEEYHLIVRNSLAKARGNAVQVEQEKFI